MRGRAAQKEPSVRSWKTEYKPTSAARELCDLKEVLSLSLSRLLICEMGLRPPTCLTLRLYKIKKMVEFCTVMWLKSADFQGPTETSLAETMLTDKVSILSMLIKWLQYTIPSSPLQGGNLTPPVAG